MLTFLALSQDWIPYGVAAAYVAIHHGVVLLRDGLPAGPPAERREPRLSRWSIPRRGAVPRK
jgi:hypothetical protein